MKNFLLIFVLLIHSIFLSSCLKDDMGIYKEDDTTQKQPEGNRLLKSINTYSGPSSTVALLTKIFEYNSENKISKVTDWFDGNIIAYESMVYDSIGRLSKTIHFEANSDAPDGFTNTFTYVLEYDSTGKLIKRFKEYPEYESSECVVYEYSNNQVIKESSFNLVQKLEQYTYYVYDAFGNMLFEQVYIEGDQGDQLLLETEHLYKNNLQVKSIVYHLNPDRIVLREILKSYDINNNLVEVSSIEKAIYSSANSYVMRYEYY